MILFVNIQGSGETDFFSCEFKIENKIYINFKRFLIIFSLQKWQRREAKEK